jgi:hypothetical protein
MFDLDASSNAADLMNAGDGYNPAIVSFGMAAPTTGGGDLDWAYNAMIGDVDDD